MKSFEELSQNLINAKKVMNKVSTGDFTKGHVDANIISKEPEEVMKMATARNSSINDGFNPVNENHLLLDNGSLNVSSVTKSVSNSEPKNVYDKRVRSSKLPDDIKKIMIENQISQPDINLSNSLDMAFVEKVQKNMEKLNLSTPKKKPEQRQQQKQQQKQPIKETYVSKEYSLNEAVLRELKPLIEHIIETSVTKIVNEKIAKLEKKMNTMNEGIQIKVGDTIFTGTITGQKRVK